MPKFIGSVSCLMHFLFVVQLVSMGAMEMSGPFWSVHLKSLSLTSELRFSGTAVYVLPMVGIMLTSTFWGKMGDRMGNKMMMMRALLGLSLTQFALAWTDNIMVILILRFIQGACAGYIAPAQAYGVSMIPSDKRPRLFAYLQISTNVGSFLGTLVGGIILDYLSFFWINMIAAILCLLSAISILIFLPKSPGVLSCLKEKPCLDKSIPPISDEYPRSYIFGLLMILGLLLFSRMIPQSSFSLYIIDIYKESHLTTGFCYGLQALGLVVSATCWARYFENKNIFESIKNLSFIALACVCVTLLMACLHEIKLFILLYFLWGILLGGTTPVLMALISKSAGMKQQGYVLGLAQSISQFSSIIGITIGGGYWDLHN